MNESKLAFLDRVFYSTVTAVMLLPLMPYAIAG